MFQVVADAGRLKAVADEAAVPKEYILGLNRLLLFHRFKPEPLRKIEGVAAGHVLALESRRLKNTQDILMAGATAAGRAGLSADTCVSLDEIARLVTASDLMRKPGIKAMKMRLFTACGIVSLKHLGEQEPEAFRARLAELIAATGVARAVPTPKEVASDVCWARLYSVIVSVEPGERGRRRGMGRQRLGPSGALSRSTRAESSAADISSGVSSSHIMDR